MEKVTQLDNSQEPDVGAVTNDAIPVKKHETNLNRQIAYESEAAYRARISTGVGVRKQSCEELDDDDSPGEKMRHGTSSRKETRQGASEEDNVDYSC